MRIQARSLNKQASRSIETVTNMNNPSLNEEIRAALFQLREAHPHCHIHVLLDGNHPCFEGDPLHLHQLAKREIPANPIIVPRADYLHDPSICPALVTLHSPGDRGYPDDELFDLAIAHAWRRRASINGSYVAGWLVSEKPAKEVAAHIAESCELFDLLNGRRRFLPLFEPHRLSLLANTDRKSFLHRWLGPISHWLWLDLNGQLNNLAAHDLNRDGTSPGEQLEQRDWMMQHRVADARLVAMAIQEAQHRLPSNPEIAIDASLKRAKARGLQRTEDLIFTALNDFSLSAGWADHLAAQWAIEQALVGERSLSKVMTTLPDEILNEIANNRPAD